MQKAVENILFDLEFGIGFSIAAAVCRLIAGLLGQAHGGQ